MSTAPSVDPVLTTVIQRKLQGIAEEIAITLLRSTRSPLLNQAGDLGTGVLDTEARLLAGAEYIPIIALSLPMAGRAVREYFGDDVRPGDVILHNDVFSGGIQLSDAGVIVPVFHDDELIGWVGSKGHQLDVGGPVPGSCNPSATDVWQEALRIPPVKVADGGTFREDVWNLIFSNVRSREIVEADMRAQIGACQVGARELKLLIDQFGVDAFKQHSAALLDATDQMMRNAIRAIPDGTYEGESIINTDADGTLRQYRVQVTITVQDDEIWLDYTGTSPQASGYTNAAFGSSASATIMALLMLVESEMPHNDGMMRPIHLNIPKGTILNCEFPAACFYGNFMSIQNVEAIMSAMAQALPERVTAAWNRAYDIRTSGVDRRSQELYHDIHFLGLKGGAGALSGMDGYNQGAPVFCPALRTHDYELNEVQDPHFLLKHEYLTDSAGAGTWRGGLGVEYICRVDADSITAVTQGDGLLEGAAGMRGGTAGAANVIELISPNGDRYRARAMEIISDVETGTVIRQVAGGGGGFGDPLDRSVDAVAADVRAGVVSVASARDDYGVVVTQDGLHTEVDLDATRAHREALRRARAGG